MRTILPVKSCRENNQGQIRGQYGGLTTDESADNRARKVERITNSSATGLALGEIPPHPPSGQIVGQLLVCGGWPWGEIPPHPRAGKSWGNCWCGPHFTLEYRHHYRISLFPSQFYSICESLQETTWGGRTSPQTPLASSLQWDCSGSLQWGVILFYSLKYRGERSPEMKPGKDRRRCAHPSPRLPVALLNMVRIAM